MSVTPTPESRPHWHEAHPERLEWELAQFAHFDLPAEHEIDAEDRFTVETALSFRGEEIAIKVVYPYEYPDVEPTVYGPAVLDRHQNRRAGNFCLLENPASDWWPGMAAAQLVDQDLRQLLEDSEAGSAAVAAGEADMPEPLSQHISADYGEVVVIPDPFWAVDLEASHGALVLKEKMLGNGHVLTSAEGFADPDEKVVDRLIPSKPVRHKGRWVALNGEALSPWPTHEDVLQAAEAADEDALIHLKRRLKQERKRTDVIGWLGVTFIEEGPGVGERRRGWVFLKVKMLRDGKRRVVKAARALALTAAERARRVPELVGLEHASVLVLGAGSVGAPIVLELAKAGVGEIDVCDFDRYDVNNAVRHVLATHWAGNRKAMAVSIEAAALNPFIAVTSHKLYVGGGPDDSAQLDQLLLKADVVVDATGSQMAARVLQRRCREFEKPLVLASLTAASYGAEVAVFQSGGPCYYCFVLGQEDGSVPKPLEGPRSHTTPVGCSTPAFSGAGFDATALAALAARTTVGASAKCAYPALEYDYVIVNFRGDDPWQQDRLEVHPGCPLCS